MNETLHTVFTAILSGATAAVVVYIAVRLGGRRASANSKRTEELEQRADANNRELAEAERGTREAIERAREENREFDRIVGEQAEDNQRAAANNRRAEELIERAESILNKKDS